MKGKKQINYVKSEYRKITCYVLWYFIVLITLAIIAFICGKGIQSFTQSGISFTEMLTSTKWNPNADQGSFGALIFIVGSTVVSLGAVIISAPIIVCYIHEFNFAKVWKKY